MIITVVTDGAVGTPEYDKNMPLHRLADLRGPELPNSARILAVKQVEFLSFEDPGQKSELADGLRKVAGKIKEIIDKQEPKIIITHGPDGEYGYPCHKVVSKCTTEAIGLFGFFGHDTEREGYHRVGHPNEHSA